MTGWAGKAFSIVPCCPFPEAGRIDKFPDRYMGDDVDSEGGKEKSGVS
jgi:hypothetical protein